MRLLRVSSDLTSAAAAPCPAFHGLSCEGYHTCLSPPSPISRSIFIRRITLSTNTKNQRRTMAVISNFNVYGLMIVPLVLVVRGHRIKLSKLIPLIFLSACVQLIVSVLVSALPAPLRPLGEAAVAPLVQVTFFAFALNDPRARKVLRLAESGDGDAPAAVAAVWCATQTVLFRWFAWYHGMANLGFEQAHLLSGACAFLSLVSALSAARRLQGRALGPVHGLVLVAYAGGVVAGHLAALELFGAAVTAALLLLAAGVFPRIEHDAKRN
ncbi:hypothetical protein STCU_04587 [Strigomonas culicis]|uniref:Uncharacterized protein n=1 Tax=Strigomonas culicis TaxID=28005 RepID=S9VQI2_9TRYP|nr:hypothetical protein STCU_04587 [Strigomonas culicis]|eukprot:EPY29376.1 hypothetical protein STCU_04587 [Strigomonas culicis]